MAVHSGKILSVLAEDTADGAKLVQWTDKGKANQQFRLGGGFFVTTAPEGVCVQVGQPPCNKQSSAGLCRRGCSRPTPGRPSRKCGQDLVVGQ
ncbi:RICIN domain-containing protein [Streptomyces sp. NPDC057686]|uniref:RICIN domain-containing protein n=1 Tax=Streptomyces sp. NPDC057686 TaxID=3346212 RepID=UPI0036D043C8